MKQSFFQSPGTAHDEDGELEFQVSMDHLDPSDFKSEPGDILMFQGEVYEVISYIRKNGKISSLRLVQHKCYEAG
jgi:hypothetical protein